MERRNEGHHASKLICNKVTFGSFRPPLGFYELNKFYSFSLLYMALAIDKMDGCGKGAKLDAVLATEGAI